MLNSRQIRQQSRRKRRSIPACYQHQHAIRVAQLLHHSPLFRFQHFACYFATDGELSLEPFIRILLAAGKQVYLPVLKRGTRALDFLPYHRHSPVHYNRFGILEPTAGQAIPVSNLDMVCLPLVAFDAAGHRLGMGGGFYDRTLACTRQQHKPVRVGIAHQCQQRPHLVKRRWDIPLHWLATENALTATTDK